MMNYDIRLFCYVYGLKLEKNKKYDLRDVDDNVVYLFNGKEELVDYFLDNGVDAISAGLVNACIRQEFTNDRILAHKKSCDRLITMLSKPSEYTFKEIKDIHERGKLTPWEAVDEWLENGVCAPKDYSRCSCFNNCKECLVNYASSKREFEPLKKENKGYVLELRKRDF